MSYGDTEPSGFHGGEARGALPLAPASRVTFDRRELNRIFGLYGRKVAAGEWRDYAIDFPRTARSSPCSAAPPKFRCTGSKKVRSWRAGKAPIA